MVKKPWTTSCHSLDCVWRISRTTEAYFSCIFTLHKAWRSTRASIHSTAHSLTEFERARPFQDIPGPKGLPYLGTVFKYRKGPFKKYNIERYQEALVDLYTTYGKICKETIAGTTVVHLFDPDHIRMMFQTEGKMPHVAPLMETTKLYRKERGLAPGLGNTLEVDNGRVDTLVHKADELSYEGWEFTYKDATKSVCRGKADIILNGEEWYKLRSAVQQMMMRPKAVAVYLPFVTEVADDFIKRLKDIRNGTGHVKNLRNEISKWNVESAAMTIFEKRLHCLNDGPDTEIQKMIDANTEMFTLSAKMKFQLPLYKIFKTPAWKKLCAAEECVYQTSEKYLSEALSRISCLSSNGELQEGQYNFLVYLLSRKELNNKDITIISLSLFGDGLSTTSPTLASCLYCLARYQEAQENVYQEIVKVMSSGSHITAEMINKMQYLKAFVKEVFRFFPIGLDVARITQQNLVIADYQIPAGTHVEMNNFVMFHNPDYFDNPERFNPNRWLRDGSAQSIHPYILTPFGHGPRMCAGRRFAEQEMYVVIIKVLQNFRIEWKHPDLRQKYQILLVPDSSVDIIFHDRT